MKTLILISLLFTGILNANTTPSCETHSAGLIKLYTQLRQVSENPELIKETKYHIYSTTNQLESIASWLGQDLFWHYHENRKIQFSYTYMTDHRLAEIGGKYDSLMERMEGSPEIYGEFDWKNDLSESKQQLAIWNLYSKDVSLEQYSCLDEQSKVTFLDDYANKDLRTLSYIEAIPSLPTHLNPEQLKNEFQTVLQDEENLWGDTILEGPFAQTGAAEISDVEALIYHERVVGFRIYIVAPAVFTDHCEFNEETYEYENCDGEGQIYVSKLLDINLDLLEDGNYAEFDI